jgi:hypothetical protein
MVDVIGNSGHTDQMTQLLRLFDKIGLVWDDTRDVRDGTKAKHDDPNEDRTLTEDSLFITPTRSRLKIALRLVEVPILISATRNMYLRNKVSKSLDATFGI